MQLGTDGRHQRGEAKPAKKTDKKHQPCDMECFHLHALKREYIEFSKLIFHDILN